jgi:hypothetical protein
MKGDEQGEFPWRKSRTAADGGCLTGCHEQPNQERTAPSRLDSAHTPGSLSSGQFLDSTHALGLDRAPATRSYPQDSAHTN